MKILVLTCSCVLAIFLVTVRKAEAHMLKTDGDIGAVIHVDPDDNPIAGEQSQLYFDVKDKTGKLSPKNCECTVHILQGDRTLTSIPLYRDSSQVNREHAVATYVFKTRGIYTILLEGKPQHENDFQPFVLSYDIRVERESQSEEKDSSERDHKKNIIDQAVPYAIVSLIAVILITYLYRKRSI